MIGAEGETVMDAQKFPPPELGSYMPFTLSIATMNAGNGKRGKEALQSAMDRMVRLSSPGAGIIGFQELPPDDAISLQATLPSHWEMKTFPNKTDEKLSMAVAYDTSRLRLEGKVHTFFLPQISKWHRLYEFPRRKVALKREAQIVHFTLVDDPKVHIVLVNAHLSARGFLKQRRKEMDLAMEELRIFMQERELVYKDSDMPFADKTVAAYVIGDFNTSGAVGSKRSQRQIKGLQLFESGFTKLNDWLSPTSNVISSAVHKAHDIWGDQTFRVTQRVEENARRGIRRERLLARALKFADQHRDHVFGKLYGLEENEVLESQVFGPPHHPRESDHYMVFTGSVLKKAA